MMLSSQEQLLCLFRCLGFGVWAAIYNDMFRVWRMLSPPSKPKWFFQDAVFCLSCGIAFYTFSLAVNAGTVRSGMLLAAIIGFAAWRGTFGRLLLSAVHHLKRFLSPMVVSVSENVKKARKKAQKTAKNLLIFLKKPLHRIRSLVYNKKSE